MQIRCHAVARRVLTELQDDHHAIVREPYVIAGNIASDQLAGWYDQTIAPSTTSMERDYFLFPPTDPITILMFSDESTYRTYSAKLFGDRRVSVYGYYQPIGRIVVVNLSSGGGTLVHELTHALIDFDYPEIPIWMNEGLSSLHEHCDIVESDAGPRIIPLMNWRLSILQSAIIEGRMPPTWNLIQVDSLRGPDEAEMYAHARYFCYYLAEQGLLKPFYVSLRDAQRRNESGDKSVVQPTHMLRKLFPTKTWSEIEFDFRRWVMEQSPEPPK